MTKTKLAVVQESPASFLTPLIGYWGIDLATHPPELLESSSSADSLEQSLTEMNTPEPVEDSRSDNC
jgi:hypothetical protein